MPQAAGQRGLVRSLGYPADQDIADQQKIRAAAWLGVQDFVRKPVSQASLAERVAYALDSPPTEPATMIDPTIIEAKLAAAQEARAATRQTVP